MEMQGEAMNQDAYEALAREMAKDVMTDAATFRRVLG